MLMTGTFLRGWGAVTAFVFAKLMLVDFGWNEIPHLFPIGALTAITFNNRLQSELDPVAALVEREGRRGTTVKQAAIVGGTAIGLAVALIFPILFALTFADRANLR
jgi:hypothetical protein